MEHISPDLWDDPRFVLYAVQRAPGALEHAQADIKVRCWGSLDIGVLWEEKLDWRTRYKCQVLWSGMNTYHQARNIPLTQLSWCMISPQELSLKEQGQYTHSNLQCKINLANLPRYHERLPDHFCNALYLLMFYKVGTWYRASGVSHDACHGISNI